MNFKEFILKQEGIYSKFRDTSKLETEGIIPKVPIQQGGYLIAYRHAPELTDRLTEFSEGVAKIVPAIAYTSKNAHTTISDLQVQDNFSPDFTVLDILCQIVHANLPLSGDVSINYCDWLLNQNTGIAAGIPNKPFFNNAKKIIDYSNEKEIALRLPWGAHITTNRFLETRTPEEIRELLVYAKSSKPLGESKPKFIDVGYFILTPNGFDYKTQERFNL